MSEDQKYQYKTCICGDQLPYDHPTRSAICLACIMNKTKISGYIGSGSVSIK